LDDARSHHARKRDADRQVGLGQIEREHIKQRTPPLPPQIRNPRLISLHDALNDLSRRDEQPSRIVEMRFFGGLSVEETADVLSISRSTTKRAWNVAEARLSRHIRRRHHGKKRTVAKD
jgi:DNA-directed RNA polymerase specialized sigma24 family protein